MGGVILIDSINLDLKCKKVCERDIVAATALKGICSNPRQEDLFRQLDEAKFSSTFWAGLVPAQCLRYDFKSFNAAGRSVGLSSVLCPLQDLLRKEGIAEATQEYLNAYDLVGVLCNTKKDGSVCREIGLMSKDANLSSNAAEFLASYENCLLQLQSLDTVDAEASALCNFKALKQNNTAASRKQVAPGCLA